MHDMLRITSPGPHLHPSHSKTELCQQWRQLLPTVSLPLISQPLVGGQPSLISVCLLITMDIVLRSWLKPPLTHTGSISGLREGREHKDRNPTPGGAC